MTDGLKAIRSNDHTAPTDTSPKNPELAPSQSVTATRLDIHTSHTRTPTAPHVTIQTENTTSITSLTHTYNILQHSKAQKPTIFNNGRYTTNIPTDPYSRHKTNMHHIHTPIVSRHLATRGNNKILRTPLPHISSSEEILTRLTRRTISQLRTNKCSNHTYTKSTPNRIHHHYAPFVTLAYTTHIISSSAPTYASYCHPWICGQTLRSDCTAGQMDGETGWWTTNGKIGLPPPH